MKKGGNIVGFQIKGGLEHGKTFLNKIKIKLLGNGFN